jgi:hypothetical protein
MSEPLSPELEAKAQELASRITARSADAILEMCHLPQKVATPLPPSTAPTADDEPPSTVAAKRRSRRSAGRSRATGPTTTADSAATAPAPGTNASD